MYFFSFYLLYIKISGAQMQAGGILRSLIFSYSDSFHIKLLSVHSYKQKFCIIMFCIYRVSQKSPLQENSKIIDQIAIQRCKGEKWGFTQVKTHQVHVLDTWLWHRCAQHPKNTHILTAQTPLSKNTATFLEDFFWDTLQKGHQ